MIEGRRGGGCRLGGRRPVNEEQPGLGPGGQRPPGLQKYVGPFLALLARRRGGGLGTAGRATGRRATGRPSHAQRAGRPPVRGRRRRRSPYLDN